ncbi:MAG: PQQ-binding-like beta-propeller repeat protein [Gemmataceae bacterium]
MRLLGICLLAAMVADRPRSDWPRFLGPAGDGTSPETGLNWKWPKAGPPKLWECELGFGYAPPTVAGGKLFHFDRVGDSARLTCRDAATGAEVWKYEYPTRYEDLYGYDPGPRACPVVDGERVYVHGVDGVLACVSVADGKEVWRTDTKAAYHVHQNFFGAGGSPLVDGDVLIVPVGGSPKGPRPADLRDAKPDGTCVVGFDKRTGKEKYRVGMDLASYATPVIATVGGKRTGLYFARGGLLGFDPQTGAEAFRFPWRAKKHDSVNAANPLVAGDKVLVTECYEKGAALLDLASGKPAVAWSDADREPNEKAMMAHWCTPVRVGGYVYGCSGQHPNDADLRCVELATGEVKWRERRTSRCTLIHVDGHLVSLGEIGELRVFKPNPDRYEEVTRWEVPGIGYPSWAPPVVSRGRLYLRGKDETRRDGHKLMCFDLLAAN